MYLSKNKYISMAFWEYILPQAIGNMLLLFVIAILIFFYLGFTMLSDNIVYLVKFVLLHIAFVLNLIEIHYIKVHYTRSYLSYVVMGIVLVFRIHAELTHTL
jgi:hypothetical protein